MMSKVEEFGIVVSNALDDIRRHLKPECKVLFAWRLPGNTEAEFSMTDDEDIDEMIQVLERSKRRPKC